MKTKTRPKVNKALAGKAKHVLEFAESWAKKPADWLELHFALFGVDGKATKLFTTEAERSAFSRTAEYKRILALMDRLPRPKNHEIRELVSSAKINGPPR